jgi:hypothetical protein
MTTSIVYNPFTQNFDFVGTGGSGGSGIQTINSNNPDGSGNYVLAGANGMTITQTAHTSTIGTPSGAFAYTTVSATSQAAIKGNAYVLTSVSLTTVFLPANAGTALGDTIKIIGLSGGYDISQAANQQIIIGADSSTPGVTGSVSCSGTVFNAITLTCVSVAGGVFIWAAIDPPQGTFTTT